MIYANLAVFGLLIAVLLACLVVEVRHANAASARMSRNLLSFHRAHRRGLPCPKSNIGPSDDFPDTDSGPTGPYGVRGMGDGNV